ncbi:MAG: hypothetical protein RH917_11930 [Lacipirellulaceae bacterium]
MKLSITDRNDCLDSNSREYAKRRLLFALSRFDNKLDFVSLVVSDINGPKGGVDKHCKLRVKIKRESEIVVSDEDSDLLTCIARVSERAGRSVSRAIDRNRLARRRSRTKDSAFQTGPWDALDADAMLPATV